MKRFYYNGQPIYIGNDAYLEIPKQLDKDEKILFVHGKSYENLPLKEVINTLPQDIVEYTGFSSNPKYEEVVTGRNIFLKENCTCIISVGGGSTIDTAKNIKLFAAMKNCNNYLIAPKKWSDIKHIAIPTTAGTGSESNCNSVLYKDGVKQSIRHESILPTAAFLIPELIYTLPEYQKKSTLMDAFCQCFESIWAINSTYASRGFASKGLMLIMEHMDSYLARDRNSCEAIMTAANLSGRAIDISQTTAAHAMSYKLSSMYGIAHGHAVSLSLPRICKHVIEHMDEASEDIIDNETTLGFITEKDWLKDMLQVLLSIIEPGETDIESLPDKIQSIVDSMGFKPLTLNSDKDLEILTSSVNPERLKNNPVPLTKETIRNIYKGIFTKVIGEKASASAGGGMNRL